MNQAPNIGETYTDHIGDQTVTITSVDFQQGRVNYKYDNGTAGRTRLNRFHQYFTKVSTQTPGLDAWAANSAAMFNLDVTNPGSSAVLNGFNIFPICECGLDITGSGGKHSDYCPKYVSERA